MLVHKRTMGVLDLYWTGAYRTGPDGVSEPVMEEFTFSSTGLPQEDWWEVPRNSALGRRLRMIYPYCTPVTAEDGSLVEALEWPKRGPDRRTPPEARPDARRTAGKQRRRKKGLLEQYLKE